MHQALRDEQLDRRQGGREQRFECPRLFADYAVSRHRHRASHGRQHQQDEKLLKDPRLDGALSAESNEAGLSPIKLLRNSRSLESDRRSP